MLLESLHISGFRCFQDVGPIPFHRLSVFIGENDSGKTAIIDALELLLTNTSPSSDDFRLSGQDQKRADEVDIRGTFLLEPHDSLPQDFRTKDGTCLIIQKSFSVAGEKCIVEGRGFVDSRWDSFPRQDAATQRELLQTIGLEPGTNEEHRNAQFDKAFRESSIPKQSQNLEIRFADITEYLPRFERVASTEYKDPDVMIQRTFQAVVDSFIRPEDPETHERHLIPGLVKVKSDISDALDAKVKKMGDVLRKVHPGLVSVQASPSVDFSRSITGVNLVIDTGEGARLVKTYGEGTKKKLWMGLIEWEREARADLATISLFRAYDEPDVNLDYSAERKLFSTILDSTDAEGSRTQAVVCTHAVTLVDRAPGQSINFIKIDPDGSRSIQFLAADDDDEVLAFLSTVGRSVGLTNSALFYERSFLVVEGESEENALPILYRHLYDRAMISDGIVLVPLHSCGAWKALLRVLLKHKAHITTILLDEDVRHEDCTSRITPQSLQEIGWPLEFLEDDCVFIGKKEFEDAFSSEHIASVLNSQWPRDDGAPWSIQQINSLREPDNSFGKDLCRLIRVAAQPTLRQSARKPEIARHIAIHCHDPHSIPEEIQLVFSMARVKAGISEA